MAEPRATLERFFDAFSRRDGEAMAACYTPDATFEDQMFSLSGGDVGDMWRMLTARGKDLVVEARNIEAAGSDGSASWEARYSVAGRPVVNRIASRFTFAADGRIAAQVDTFDFPRWAAQALGWKGKLFGRLSSFHAAARRRSAETLAEWQRRTKGAAGR